MPERTSTKLAAVLDEHNLPHLAKNARRFDYDDYKSTVTATPQILLVQHLRLAPGDHEDLIERVKAGEWDGQDWESDEWAASEEGQGAFRELLGKNSGFFKP